MKNLFSIINDYDEQKVKINYEPLIIKRLSKTEISKVSKLSKKYDDINLKTKPNRWLSVFNRLFLMLIIVSGLFFLIDFIGNIGKQTFKTIVINNLFYLCAFVIGVIAFIVCRIYLRAFRKSAIKINAEKEAKKAFNDVLAYSNKCLGVPDNNKSIEVLSEQIAIKKKQTKTSGSYINVVLSIYKTKDSLCLADLNSLIAIPLNSIVGIEKIDEPYRFKSWHKNEGIKEKKFEQYNIRIKGFNFTANCYYALKFEYNNELYSILIPAYDYDIIKVLIAEEKC